MYIVAGVAGHRNPSLLEGMFVLAMASARTKTIPSVVFDCLYHVADFHRNSSRLIVSLSLTTLFDALENRAGTLGDAQHQQSDGCVPVLLRCMVGGVTGFFAVE